MRNNSFNLFGNSNQSQQAQPIPVFVSYDAPSDDDEEDGAYDGGPIFLPVIPRQGEVLDGEWIGQDEDYEVIRVCHCVPSIQCDKPHLYLLLERLEMCRRPRDEDLRDDIKRGMKRIETLETFVRETQRTKSQPRLKRISQSKLYELRDAVGTLLDPYDERDWYGVLGPYLALCAD
jgi:hypothetical protein